MTNERQMTEMGMIREFVFAGRSTFTLLSVRTGQYYTYKVEKSDGNGYFLMILVAPDVYKYAGFIPQEKHVVFKGKRGMSPQSPSVLGFKWFLRLLSSDKEKMPNCAQFYHVGLCGRCGHELTSPESIRLGLGPICRNK